MCKIHVFSHLLKLFYFMHILLTKFALRVKKKLIKRANLEITLKIKSNKKVISQSGSKTKRILKDASSWKIHT